MKPGELVRYGSYGVSACLGIIVSVQSSNPMPDQLIRGMARPSQLSYWVFDPCDVQIHGPLLSAEVEPCS